MYVLVLPYTVPLPITVVHLFYTIVVESLSLVPFPERLPSFLYGKSRGPGGPQLGPTRTGLRQDIGPDSLTFFFFFFLARTAPTIMTN